MSDVARRPDGSVPAQRTALDAARDYARQSLAPETLRAYRTDWEDFRAWCHRGGFECLPAAPRTVAAYCADHAVSHSRAALKRRLAAIGQMHRAKGLEWIPSHPAVRHTLRGINRRHGLPARQAAALTSPEIRKLLDSCRGTNLTAARDRALLLLGFAGALRRSELAAVEREHVAFAADGLRLMVPRAKGDQEGQGAGIGVPRGKHAATCPVRALEEWLELSGCRYGPVFRKVDRWGKLSAGALHPDAVRQILKKRAALAGLAAAAFERLSPHGLRAGFVTEAYRAGARDEQIMAHTRHKDLKTMRGYVRRAKLLADSPAKLLDL